MSLTITPITLKQANAFVAQYHRHHKPVVGHKFSIGVSCQGKLVGVAIVGRPVARNLDDGTTLEVTRCCTDGTKNAVSKLYGVARRVSKELGYTRVVTYTLCTETGISLRASGWVCKGLSGGGSWNSKLRPRIDKHPTCKKLRYEVLLR